MLSINSTSYASPGLIEVPGDLFTTTAPLIAHGVNCRGAFGAGVAGQIARRWPEVRRAYNMKYDAGLVNPPMGWYLGACQVIRVATNFYVANLATQDDYGRLRLGQAPHARVDAIGQSLHCLDRWVNEYGISHVAMPRLGCGLGGLRWDDVRPVVAEWADRNRLRVEVWYQDDPS